MHKEMERAEYHAGLILRDISATLPLIAREPEIYEDIEARLESLARFIPGPTTGPRAVAAYILLHEDLQRRRADTSYSPSPRYRALIARGEAFLNSVFEVVTPRALQQWRQSPNEWHSALYNSLWQELYRRCLLAPEDQLQRHYEVMEYYFADTHPLLAHILHARELRATNATPTPSA